ncbi:hypothetical protein [Phyllobacterium leguminum]|uniref:Uncharacterized protein n=1 Tax=Phyllobacterium leguminum TaxID=314237 RepID=A0A318T698_9HYPH|nr:hypothetical protein [Phyllobacterium leguminum]PYE88764.1 hypothetical protein C7477_106137 [Phyllobacterium leguminum]
MKGDRRYWKIEGYDSTELIFERVIPVYWASEKCMMDLLCRLASKHLSENEIIEASLNGHHLGGNALLEPQVSPGGASRRYSISVGHPNYYIASAWLKSELVAKGYVFSKNGQVICPGGVLKP